MRGGAGGCGDVDDDDALRGGRREDVFWSYGEEIGVVGFDPRGSKLGRGAHGINVRVIESEIGVFVRHGCERQVRYLF